MYLLTRPAPNLEKSQQAFDALGVKVSVLGLNDIAFMKGADDKLALMLKQHSADILIFTSQFAVKACASALSAAVSVPVLAVGKGTAQALAGYGVEAVVPEEPTSEGLLALPQLIDANQRQVVIIKGKAGRTTLADTLTERGASVLPMPVYQRVIPPVFRQTNYWQWSDVKGIIATSEEMARQLFDRLNNTELTRQRWLTVSTRVADVIRSYGVTDVEVATGASDTELGQWIKDNWE